VREHDRFGAAVAAGGEQFERAAPSGGRARACARRGLGCLRKTSSGAYPRAMRESSQSRDARVEPEGRRWGRLVVIERAGSDQSHQSDQPSGAWRALRLRRNHRGRRRATGLVKCDCEVVS
jgi:hypothetical protein